MEHIHHGATTRGERSATRIVLGAALALLTLIAAACGSDAATDASQDTGIAVTGVGRVSVAPDVAVLEFGAETIASTVAEARDRAAEAMTATRDSLAANGVEDRDIRTRSFTIYPRFDYGDGEPELTGFSVGNYIEVRIREIDEASRIIDEVIAAAGDAIRVGGIRFEVDDPTPHPEEARRRAVADALAKAQQLADLAAVELGKVRTIVESAGGSATPQRVTAEAAFDDSGSSGTPIAAGEGEIVVSVGIVYEIE